MFIKSLEITTPTKVIRELTFHKGLNLIIDETANTLTDTGNNVGKTTVLRLIDFCFGNEAKSIYTDPENKRTDDILVKNFLIDNEVVITLTLTNNFEQDDIVIRRNFLQRNRAIREINGTHYNNNNDFEDGLMTHIFPELNLDKPTFRQIISHNIRYEEQRLTNTLKILNSYTTDAEYETLYLFMFGCRFEQGDTRQELLLNIQNEDKFKSRLERIETKNTYESVLAVIDDDIAKLNKKKSQLNLNPDFETDLNSLNQIKFHINSLSTDLTALNIRKDIINETLREFETQKTDIDLSQLNLIYQQASALIPALQKRFEDLVAYHNQMLEQKAKFLKEDLPNLETQIKNKNNELSRLSYQEQELSNKLVKSDTFEDLEFIINKLNDLYRKKGEYESIVSQIAEVELNLKQYSDELKAIDEQLFSDDFEECIKRQLNKFNKIFAKISEQLYSERYIITHEIVTNRRGQKVYKFKSHNVNFSSGKKQGEITCFDIAYTIFADENNIPCLHFLLNDKKELMHDNQLVKIAEIVNKHNIQFVASILKDKIPEEWNVEDYFVVKLSQNDKLFRIEN
jgi:uncharacterized protein YydD (DUF2326 family)